MHFDRELISISFLAIFSVNVFGFLVYITILCFGEATSVSALVPRNASDTDLFRLYTCGKTVGGLSYFNVNFVLSSSSSYINIC